MNENAVAAGARIIEDVTRLASLITDAQYQAEPHWRTKYGGYGYSRALEDTRYHLLVLAQALSIESPALLMEYARWAAVVLHTRGITGMHRDSCLFGYAEEVLRAELPQAQADIATQYAAAAALEMSTAVIELPASFLPDAGDLEPLARWYLEALLAAKRDEAERLIHNAREDGIPAEDLCLRVLSICQREVGRLWQVNERTVAQEHFCTAATLRLLSELYSQLVQKASDRGTVVVACVGGELHDVGSRMVADFMQAAGWVTYYLGQSTPPAGIVKMLEMTGAGVLALSCTMSFHLKQLMETIAAVRQNPATSTVRIIVGGRIFEHAPALPEKLAADGYARDAEAACAMAWALR